MVAAGVAAAAAGGGVQRLLQEVRLGEVETQPVEMHWKREMDSLMPHFLSRLLGLKRLFAVVVMVARERQLQSRQEGEEGQSRVL